VKHREQRFGLVVEVLSWRTALRRVETEANNPRPKRSEPTSGPGGFSDEPPRALGCVRLLTVIIHPFLGTGIIGDLNNGAPSGTSARWDSKRAKTKARLWPLVREWALCIIRRNRRHAEPWRPSKALAPDGPLWGLPSRDGPEWFSLACAWAILASAEGRGWAGLSTGAATDLADQAMADLRRAAAMGWRNLAQCRYAPALAPLRGRDDFRLLLLDLAMPAEAFAAPR
jgi:hypothetical protein